MSMLDRCRYAAVMLLLLVAAPASTDQAHHDDEPPHDEEHGAAHDHGERDDHGGFTVADFQRHGVVLVMAGPGTVDQAVELPGEVRPDADRTAHLAPRFAGVVREVRTEVGRRVRGGDVLAVIVSDTLAPFELRAPFDGTIVDRHVAVGETVGPERAAFIITDLSRVWIDLNVYQKDLPAVQPGQAVRISAGYGIAEAEGTVAYVSPVLDQATRTAVARIVLANSDGRWKPGLFVTAHVLRPVHADVVIARTALQQVDGESVVFVADGDRFAPRPVRIGRQGRTMVEIVAGLRPDDRYAAQQSFLIKAELEKGADGHAH